MENDKNKKSVKFQGDMLIFCDFIQVFVFTTNHHLKVAKTQRTKFTSENLKKNVVKSIEWRAIFLFFFFFFYLSTIIIERRRGRVIRAARLWCRASP